MAHGSLSGQLNIFKKSNSEKKEKRGLHFPFCWESVLSVLDLFVR